MKLEIELDEEDTESLKLFYLKKRNGKPTKENLEAFVTDLLMSFID
jgi:hypothetical protein